MISLSFTRTSVLSLLLFFITLNVSAQSDGEEIKLKVKKISKNQIYGTTPETAIKVGTVSNEYDFLNMLCGPNGEKITFNRIKSCCEFDCPSCPMGAGLLDEWEIKYEGQKEPLIVYLNGYLYAKPKVPYGLELK
ncbi:MAG: hypothetical protein ACJA0U_001855 [Salibacteraceae bacterium]|jgi:hypothetical protein